MDTLIKILLAAALFGTAVSQADVDPLQCTFPHSRPKTEHGILTIPKTLADCGYETTDSTRFLAINTASLKLQSGDYMEVGSSRLFPPFAGGWYITDEPHPDIDFHFNNTDNSTMYAEFIQSTDNWFTINGDLDNVLLVNKTGATSLNLLITKTMSDFVHLEVEGNAQVYNTSSWHMLLNNATSRVIITLTGPGPIVIKTSAALASCSGTYTDKTELSHEITGPDASKLTLSNYKCVTMFTATLPGDQGHYEANFKDFLGLTDANDQLTLDDGSKLVIDSASVAGSYMNKTITFKSSPLVVIYNSPHRVKPTQIQFKLTVQARQNGGLVTESGFLPFPTSGGGSVRYVLWPNHQHQAILNISSAIKVQDLTLTLANDDGEVVQLTPSKKLPPMVAIDQPTAMTVTAKSFASLKNMFYFNSTSSPTPCHKLLATTTGSFSLRGGNQTGECYWTLASPDNVRLSFKDYSLSSGCLTVQPLSSDKPIFSKCGLSAQDYIPDIIVRQAYITVTTKSNNSTLAASVTPYKIANLIRLQPASTTAVTSIGYPSSYVWSSESQTFSLNGTKTNYLVSFDDIDLRAGEKLLVANKEVIYANKTLDDMIISGSMTNITISKSVATSDMSSHRGYKMSVTQFDQVIISDTKSKQIITPKNATSLLVKIAAPNKRISYQITSSNTTLAQISVHDGRSLRNHKVDATWSSANQSISGNTTSDTLMLSYRVVKGSVTLPELTIVYGNYACNTTTDHVCDGNTRCIPVEKLCKGISYCDDGSDIKLACSSGPAPPAKIIETGMGGFTVFILSILMLILGSVATLYGPDLYKNLENRFRSGQYTTFSSME